MCDPKTCLECSLTHLLYRASPRMADPQVAQQQMHTHASSWSVEMMAIARHQPLTAWPPSHARKRPVKPAYKSATILQMLARHSMHAKQAPATPPAAPAASATPVSPSAASPPAAAPPAAPAPAQQHARIQFRTMMPPKMPQTAGDAVCGALLPTMGTLTGGATAGSGASGTAGRALATLSVVPVTPFPTVEVAPVTASGAWRRVPSASGTKPTKRTRTQQTAVLDMLPNAGCET